MSPGKNLISCAITLCIILSITLELQGQQSPTQKWITFHNHTYIVQHFQYSTPRSAGFTEHFQKDDVEYVNLGLGYRIMNEKGRFQEFSLIQLNFHKGDNSRVIDFEDAQALEPVSSDLTKEVNLRLRWAYGMYFSLNNSEKIKPGISLGIDPVWNSYRDIPKSSLGIPLTYHQIGFDLRIIPATTLQLTSRLQLQLAFPVGLLANRWNFSKLENPILPEGERSQNSYESEFGFNDVQIRVGLGIEL